MADQSVFITGIDPKLPKWATDVTLQGIAVEIKKMVEILQKKKDIKELQVKKAQDSVDDFESALQKLNQEQETAKKSVKSLWQSFGIASEETADSFEKVKGALKGNFTGMTNLTNIGEGLFGVFKNLLSPAGVLGATFVLGGKAVSEFIDYLKNTSQAMIGLYDTGLTFQNGLGELRMAASTAAMPLDEFGRLITKNAAVIKSFGSEGAQGFADVTKQTRELVRQQGYYGLNVNQVNEYVGDYLEILRSQGLLTRMSDMERAQSSAEYIRQLTSFSQILGKSREEINKNIQETLRNPEILAITGSLGPLGKQFTDSLTTMIGGLSGVGGQQMDKVISDFVTMIGTLNGPMTDLYQGLVAAGRADIGKELLDLANDIKSGNVTAEDAAQRRNKIFGQIENLSQEDLQNLRNSTQVRGSALHDQAELILSLNSNLQGFNAVTGEMLKPEDKFTQAVVKLSNLFIEIRGRIAGVFARFLEANQDQLDRIMNNISDFAEYLAKKLEVVLDIIGNLIDPKTRDKAIQDIKNGISSLISTIVQYMSDMISAGLYKATHGLIGQSPEYIQAKQKYGATIAGYVTDKDQVERWKLMKQGGMKAFFGTTALDEIKYQQFTKAAQAQGLNPDTLLNPGPSSPALSDKIMNNSPVIVNANSGADVQTLVDKQNQMFFKPTLDALQQNNDLTAQNNQLTSDANNHLSGIKRSANSNPNIVKLQ